MSQNSPLMRRIMFVWRGQTTYEQRKAFINYTLHNDRDEKTVQLFLEVAQKIQAVMRSGHVSYTIDKKLDGRSTLIESGWKYFAGRITIFSRITLGMVEARLRSTSG